MLTKPIGVTILQYIHVSLFVVHLKQVQCYMSVISQ